jgi:ketosteroid isomerase-like protein
VSEKSNIDAEKAHLLRRDAEWVLAASEGRDIERILSFWTDDAVVLPPDLPAIIGKAALRQYVEEYSSVLPNSLLVREKSRCGGMVDATDLKSVGP